MSGRPIHDSGMRIAAAGEGEEIVIPRDENASGRYGISELFVVVCRQSSGFGGSSYVNSAEA